MACTPHEQKRGRFILPLFFAFVALALGGCPAKADRHQVTRLVVALEAAPTNLDPRLATDAYSERIGQLIFNKLVVLNEQMAPVGDLAASWDTLSPTIYRFHLRPGVLFHDGTRLTAKDVAYTFEWIRDPKHASPHRAAYEVIQRIVVEDPVTIRFELARPYAPFLVSMMRGIVPARAGDLPDFKDRPIGSGPYRLTENLPERLTLTANPRYRDGAPPTPILEFRILPEGTVRMLGLKKGDVHLIVNAVPPDSVELLARDPHLVVERGEGSNYGYLGFNMEDPALKNRRVRQAIAHAIDRQGIIDSIYRGGARAANGMFTPRHWAYEGNVASYPYDPAQARALLDKAGFPAVSGVRFKLTFKTSQDEVARRIAEVLQQQLAAVGITIDIRSYEWGTFYSDIKQGNFQLYTLSWVGVADPDIFYNTFHSASIPPAGANRGRYRNPEMDRLLEQGRLALTVDERRRIYSQVQKIAAEDLPYVALWHPDVVVVRDRRLTGFRVMPMGDFTSLATARLTPE